MLWAIEFRPFGALHRSKKNIFFKEILGVSHLTNGKSRQLKSVQRLIRIRVVGLQNLLKPAYDAVNQITQGAFTDHAGANPRHHRSAGKECRSAAQRQGRRPSYCYRIGYA